MKKILLALFFLALSSLYLSNLWVAIDAGWDAEPAYNLAFHGFLGLKSWEGFQNWEKYVYWWNPMYLILLGGFYKLLGFGIIQTFFLSFIILSSVLYLVYHIAKKYFNERIAFLSLVWLLFDWHYIARTFFNNRPDTLIGLINLVILLIILRKEEGKNFFLAGLLAGISFTFHPIGGIMLFSLLVYIKIHHRTWRNAIGTCLAFFVGIIPWLYYISLDFNTFLVQFLSNVSKGQTMLSSIVSEYTRYIYFLEFPNIVGLPIILLLLVALIYILKERRIDFLSIVIVTHFIAFFFFTNKTNVYLFSFFPLLYIYASGTLLKTYTKKIVYLLLALTVLMGLAAHIGYFALEAQNFNFYETFSYLENKNLTRVVAQPSFFFAFKEELYAFDAIYARVNEGKDFNQVIKEVDPNYFVIDNHHMQRMLSRDPDFINLFQSYLKTNAKKLETFCFINRKFVSSEELCKDNRYKIDIYTANK